MTFVHLKVHPVLHLSGFCAYFEAEVPVVQRGPTRFTAEGCCGRRHSRHAHALCWLLADILLLLAAADHVPQSSERPGCHGHASLVPVFWKDQEIRWKDSNVQILKIN